MAPPFVIALGEASADSPDFEFVQWADARLTMPIADALTFSASGISGRNPILTRFDHLAMDCWVYVGGTLRFRGRVIPETDSLGVDSHIVALTAVDYRRLLDRRFLVSALTFTADDQADIAWDLIAHTQSQTGGSWGITQGLSPSGQPRDRTEWVIGDNIGDLLRDLSEVIDGFDWEISPALELNIWSPRRTRATDLALHFGGTVAAMEVSNPSDGFANAVIVTGDDETTTPVVAVSSTVAANPAGRWEAAFAFSSIILQQTLQDKADFLLSQMEVPRRSFTCSLSQDAIRSLVAAGGDVLPGDIVEVSAVSGWVNAPLVPARIVSVEWSTTGDVASSVASCTVEAVEEIGEESS